MRAGSLPRLDGTFGTIARLSYLSLAALTAVIVAGSVIFNGLDFFRNMPAAASWGLRTFSSTKVGTPPYLGWVSLQAQQRGLRVNDVIVAIEGKALASDATEFDIGKRLNAVSGNTVSLTTRATDGSVAVHSVPREPHFWRQADFRNQLPLWLSSIATFLGIELIPIFLLGASLLLFSRRPTDAEAMLFAVGFLLLCNFPVSDFWLLAILDVPTFVTGNLLAAGQCIVIIAAAGFPDGNFSSRWSRTVLIAAVPLTVLNRIIHGFAPNAETSGAISAATLLLLGGIAMIGLSRRYQLIEDVRARQQIKWIVLGFCVSAVASAAYMGLVNSNVSIDGEAQQFIAFQILQLLAFVALPLGLVVSLLRYRLYDAEATISRTVAYSLLTVSFLAVFAGTERVIELLGEQYFGEELGALAGGLGAAVAAVMIVPIHQRVTHWAEHRFRSDLAQLRLGLPLLVGDLRETATPQVLANTMLARVETGVRARYGAVIMANAVIGTRDIEPEAVAAWWAERRHVVEVTGDFVCERGDPLFPVRVPLRSDGIGLVAYLLVGPRPDGSFYGRAEQAALREIAEPIARALAIAVEREYRESARQARENDLAHRVGVLTQRMDQLSSFMLERYGLGTSVDGPRHKLGER